MGTKPHGRTRGRALSEDEGAVQDVEVQVDESAKTPVAMPVDDSGFADFAVTGTGVTGEFRCADCGYGAVVRRALPPCPMCGGTVWESRSPRCAR
jgi:rubrerythrin